MKKKKMVTWVCECRCREEKFICKLITEDAEIPFACPFGCDDKTNWKKKEKK